MNSPADVRYHQHSHIEQSWIDTLLDISVDAIILIDDQQRILRFNQGAERIFGYSAREAIGQPLDILIPPALVDAHQQHVQAFAHSGVPSRLMNRRQEIAGRRKDGSEFPAEASIARVTTPEGGAFLAILRDLTAHKQAEAALRRSEDRFRRIFDYSNDAILVIDLEDGAIIDANPRACSLFGYENEALRSMHISNLHPRDSLQFRAFTRSVLQQTIGWTDELTYLTQSGEKLACEVSASITDSDGRHLMIALVRDVSERKELQQMKEAFVSNVSHELRTPITNIKLHHELLAQIPDKQELYLERLTRETNRLQLIVENLLFLSRLHREQVYQFAPTDLNIIAGQLVADRRTLAQENQLTLAFEATPGLPPVKADEALIVRVLSILLTNAFDYTPPGGQIGVNTSLRRENGTAWAGFQIADTGLGIDDEDRRLLFERFSRGKAAAELNVPGTGLGLAIAKEIVDRHGGVIEVESEGIPGTGSTFTVWLAADGTNGRIHSSEVL
jgi:PAS domain S-box-containing protein